MRQHIDTTHPSSTSSTHTSKSKTHPLPNHFCISQNRRHANEGTSLQGGFYHQPNRSAQTHRPDLLPNGQLLRNRTTLAHLSSTRAQGSPTLPTTRRRSRGAPPCAPTRPERLTRCAPRQDANLLQAGLLGPTEGTGLPCHVGSPADNHPAIH